ncbi:SRPBCC family protein [Nocardia brevicatena]|uniref:SRPBCC family protein n=1 Tax=Nocardia brevicatena TaxID=37327 RepID=UPI0002D6E8FB|nr:SRPBCC family protein [Nocardia brevicatena]
MRMKTGISFVVDADPDRTMDVLTAVEMMPEWSSVYSDARVAGRDELGRPLRVFVKAALLNFLDDQVLEYTWTDNRCSWKVADSTRGAKGGGYIEIDIDADAGGTEVRYGIDMYMPLPVPGILLKRSVRKALEAMVPSFTAFVQQYPERENYQTI